MSRERDYSISCARFIAMCFIVACHMMQRDDFASNINGAHISWAFWFNVGVQMFLFLSGYLYGKKENINTVEFYKKGYPKLLVDYYVFIFVMLVIIHFSPLLDIDNHTVIGLLTFSGTAAGLGHLWFIPTILFCYLLTPIFSAVINALDKRSTIRFWIESILLLLIVHIVIERLFGAFSPAWINCFLLGMIYSRIEQRGKTNIHIFQTISTILCAIVVTIQFCTDYWHMSNLQVILGKRYEYLCNYGHVFLGLSIIFLIRYIYKKYTSIGNKHPILDWSDKYSYDIYLTHHVFVQSAFGCVVFISNRWIALPLAIVLTIIATVLLYHVSQFARNQCIKLYRRLPK